MNKEQKINYLRKENKTLSEIINRIQDKKNYLINTGILNELNYLLINKKISYKKYKLLYRKFILKTIFNRDTNLKFYNKTGIAFIDPNRQKEFLKNWIFKNAKKINKLK